METGINVHFSDEIGIIVIDKPKQPNALDQLSVVAFKSAINKINTDDKIMAAVITGSYDQFCAGADLTEMATQDPDFQTWAGANGPLVKGGH